MKDLKKTVPREIYSELKAAYVYNTELKLEELAHPEMAEEYSKSNPYDLDWISYSGWYDFDEPLKWKCSKCNHEYDMLFKRKVLFGDRACPYCNGILPTHEYSLAYVIRIFEPPIQPHDMLLVVLFL